MTREPQRPDSNPESSKATLLALERDRETVFTQKEYHQIREAILSELARGPKLDYSFLATLIFVGVLCLSFALLGLVLFLRGVVPDVALLVASSAALVIWAFVLRSYLRDLRQRALRAITERVLEVRELREANLLTQDEHDRIYAAIMMSRESSGGAFRTRASGGPASS